MKATLSAFAILPAIYCIVILFNLLIVTGCQPDPEMNQVSLQISPEISTDPEIGGVNPLEATGISIDYPSSPEGVVYHFLLSWNDPSRDKLQYISQSIHDDLQNSGWISRDTIIEGFSIQSASVNPDLPAAGVTVAMLTSLEVRSIFFYLTQENGRWVISNVQ